jgi:hypothetical protein
MGDHCWIVAGMPAEQKQLIRVILSIPTNAHFIKAQNATLPVLHISYM